MNSLQAGLIFTINLTRYDAGNNNSLVRGNCYGNMTTMLPIKALSTHFGQRAVRK